MKGLLPLLHVLKLLNGLLSMTLSLFPRNNWTFSSQDGPATISSLKVLETTERYSQSMDAQFIIIAQA